MSKHLPYDRSERVADAIYHLVAEAVLNELSDPRLKDVIVTRVRMTKDLRIARVYFHIPAMTEDSVKRTEQGFVSASGFLRRRIGEELSLKFTPEIEFYYDEAIDISDKIDDLLANIKGGAANG